MKQVFLVLKFMLVCLLFFKIPGFAANQKLPLINGKRAVAAVNDEPITLEEFNRAIAFSHATRSKGKKAGRIDYSGILNRLINTRLIVLEARNMGLNELPEIKSMMDQYSRRNLIDLLLEQHVKDLKADEDEVERIYKDTVKEWKIKAARFEKEDDIKKIEEEIKAGHNFDELVEKAVKEGTATGGGEVEYIKDKDLTPSMARLVSKMKIGSISPVVSVGKKGFVIFRLEGVHFPEDEYPEARKQAKRKALNRKRIQAAKDYYRDLKKKYVKVNEEFLNDLDFEAKEPGFEKLLKDERVIAKIRGEKPVTVADLSKALKQKFYHGIDQAVQGKKVNKEKFERLEGILEKRVLLKEAFKQDIDKTEVYRNKVKEYEYSLIFGAFIKKVVTPDIKLDIQELKTYYKENTDEYTLPQMVRIKSLMFWKRKDAVAALNKLQKGTDFNWLSSNAEGQVNEERKGLLKFEGRLITLSSLPEELETIVAQSKLGDFRLYASSQGHFYVIYIYHVVPAKPQPFEDVKKKIAKTVFKKKLKKAVELYADKLREYYPVKIYSKDLRS
jgi:hypothetical protein